jgi:hypothetical protein
VTLGAEPPRQWRLEIDPASSESVQRRRDRWLGGSRPAASAE